MALDKSAIAYLALVILAIGLVAAVLVKPQIVNVGAGAASNTLDVSAEGIASADPNIAYVYVTVDTEDDAKADIAQAANADKVAALKLALTGSGYVKEVTTTSYNVYPFYDYSFGSSVLMGYKVSHTLKITTEKVNTVGKILDIAVEKGATSVDYVQFSLSDDKETEAKGQALEAAADKAEEKAKTLASATGVNIGKPLKVTESSYYYSPVYYSGAKMAMAESDTQVTPGQIEVSASVSISYQIV